MSTLHAKPFPLLEIVDRLISDLRGHLDPALRQGLVEPIHQARVTTRRLKAALDLVREAVAPMHRRPLVRATRRLRRSLGPIRDADVMLEQLEELVIGSSDAPDSAVGSAAIAAAAGHLAGQLRQHRQDAHHDASRAKVLRRVEAALHRWADLRRDLARLEPAVEALIAAAVRDHLDAFEARAAALAQPSAAMQSDPHALRIAGKKLRYTLEIATRHGLAVPDDALRVFKQMQSALGKWHDAVMLAERAVDEAAQPGSAYGDPDAYLGMLDLARDAMTRGKSRLESFGALWRERGQALAQEIRQSFPQNPTAEAPDKAPVADMISHAQSAVEG
jgi:CHAD domain-containing protein